MTVKRHWTPPVARSLSSKVHMWCSRCVAPPWSSPLLLITHSGPSVYACDVASNENQRGVASLSLISAARRVKMEDVFFSRSSCAVRGLAVCMHFVPCCISACVYVAVRDRWVQGTSPHSAPESSALPWSRPLVSMVIFSLRFLPLLTHWNAARGLSGRGKKKKKGVKV